MEKKMTDNNLEKMAVLLVDYSAGVKKGDKVVVEAGTVAEPLVQAIYKRILQKGGFPHVLFDLQDQMETFYRFASDEQIDFLPVFHQLGIESFDARIKLLSETNTRALTAVNTDRIARLQKSRAPLLQTMMERGGDGSLRWIGTLYPTQAYAMEAKMGFQEYSEFVFRACHVDEVTPDPVEYWLDIEKQQRKYIEMLKGHDQVEIKGTNVDLNLSIRERIFLNSCGKHNLPDGEIYTGPVEDSANGWVRFSYPAIYSGRVVEGIELSFENGKVKKVSATKEEELLKKMIATDPRSSYLGEFAFGTNFEIDRFTSNILFDEKIGGTFHLALGSGYPETGSQNRSSIHWDMICDMRSDAEMKLDGEVIYRNGKFLV
jgi:aminopeptidase